MDEGSIWLSFHFISTLIIIILILRFLLSAYFITIIVNVIIFLSLIFLVTSFSLPLVFKMLFIVFPFLTLYPFITDFGLIHFMNQSSRTPCWILWSMIVVMHWQFCGFPFQVVIRDSCICLFTTKHLFPLLSTSSIHHTCIIWCDVFPYTMS